jgi:hypothetical protein
MKLLTPDKVTLGFIGLGNMGIRIAQRLLDHGYPLDCRIYRREVRVFRDFPLWLRSCGLRVCAYSFPLSLGS